MAKRKASRSSAKSKTSVKKSAAKAKKPAAKKVGKKAGKKAVKAPPAKVPAKGKWVYAFGGGKAEGKSEMKNLLGGKGANLAEMANLGLPVPPGFTITTEVCVYYYANGEKYPAAL